MRAIRWIGFVIPGSFFELSQSDPDLMAERMTRDMVFDHEEAVRAFGFNPRRFELSQGDLPELAKAWV